MTPPLSPQSVEGSFPLRPLDPSWMDETEPFSSQSTPYQVQKSASSIHPSMDTSRSTGWEYTEPESYNVIDTHVHVWETDGVMSAKSGVASTSPHATPGLRSAPPRWESEPTDSGRVELLLDDMERERPRCSCPRFGHPG